VFECGLVKDEIEGECCAEVVKDEAEYPANVSIDRPSYKTPGAIPCYQEQADELSINIISGPGASICPL